MKKIGVLFGADDDFAGALVERIQSRDTGVQAEPVHLGAVSLHRPPDYAVIVDRIAHAVPFYRAGLKHAALHGTVVFNDPFEFPREDPFSMRAVAKQLGIPAAPAVVLPHKHPPRGIDGNALKNLQYPLDWEAIFVEIGFPATVKHLNGSRTRYVHDRDEFFRAYDESGDEAVMLEKALDFSEHYRCFVIGDQARTVRYDPRRPEADRSLGSTETAGNLALHALKLREALGLDLLTVDFGIYDGVAHVSDFLLPTPQPGLRQQSPQDFDWIVDAMADLAVARATASRGGLRKTPELAGKPAKRSPAKKKSAAGTQSAGKSSQSAGKSSRKSARGSDSAGVAASTGTE